ncbi:MAG: hypothetical protein LBF58_10070 [Deltaproteobacteria bacterium]|jgi:hypothetical protein|nr:hypothetical protein [Deltaproteobacteria bacterium]
MGQDILANLIPHLEPWWGTLGVIVALIGLTLTVKGLAGLANRPRGGARMAFVTLLSGILLLNAPEFMDVLAQTLFSRDSADVLSYRPPAHAASGIFRLVVLVVGLTGVIGVARGIYILRLSGGEGGGLPRALVHIAGGILCVNLVEFLRLLAASLGGEAESIVTSVIG